MPYHQAGAVRYFTFETFSDFPLIHAVFTRRGGVSLEPWGELNVGATVGDDPAHVAENRLRCFQTMGRRMESLFDSWLEHGKTYVVADRPRNPSAKYPPRADIILTNRREVTLFMRFADCVPLLFYDPVKHSVALAHSGWLGTVRNTAGEAVRAMVEVFESNPGDICAAIGPSIGPDHYEIGGGVIREVERAFHGVEDLVLSSKGGATYLDLWVANRLRLEDEGVGTIECAEICTACDTGDWFSHRAEGGKTGRFGVLLALKDL